MFGLALLIKKYKLIWFIVYVLLALPHHNVMWVIKGTTTLQMAYTSLVLIADYYYVRIFHNTWSIRKHFVIFLS